MNRFFAHLRSSAGLLLALSHCSFGPSASQKAEAGRISRAIDVLRDAPNGQKSEFFGVLRRVSCETPDLCELQRLCLAGYTEHLRGLSQTTAAKTLLATGGPEPQVAQMLDSAKADLAQAEAKLARCADAQGAAHRKYKL